MSNVNIGQQPVAVSWQTSDTVRPSAATDLEVRRALASLRVSAPEGELTFFRSQSPVLAAIAGRAARVADARARGDGHTTAGVERNVSFLVGERDALIAVAVSYGFRGPFKAETTIMVEPHSMRAAYL